jgi:hypothetical protein
MSDPIDECHGKSTCPWNDRKSERWVEAVDAAPWDLRGGGEWIKTIDCPRCGHPMTVRYKGSIIVAVVAEIEEIHGDSPDFAERSAELRTVGGAVGDEACGREMSLGN